MWGRRGGHSNRGSAARSRRRTAITMGNGVPFLDIILLAMLAGFVIFKLRSVLGKRTGNERRRPDPFAEPAKSNDNGKVVRLPDRSAEAAAEPGAEDRKSTRLNSSH